MKIKSAWASLIRDVVTIVALVAALTVTACSARGYHIAVVADTALYEVLNDVFHAEQMALCGQPVCAGLNPMPPPTVPGWDLTRSQAFNKQLLPAVTAGNQFNQILEKWQPGKMPPMELFQLTMDINRSLAVILVAMPEGPQKAAIVERLNRAQSSVLNIVTQLLNRATR
jgi:hypothetical protein